MTIAESAAPVLKQSAPWIVRLGRLGYVVKGFVYIIVGLLATEAAIGVGGGTTDTRGALRVVGEGPLGRLPLIVVAVGLLGYAAWRLVSAVTDAERRGDEPTKIALRIGEAIRGLAYGSLGVWTLRYLFRGHMETNDQARAAASRVLSLPAGRWLVIGIGLGFVGYALYQMYRAFSGKFLKRLDLSSADPRARKWIERLGEFGIAARAVVFGTIGILVTAAGWNYNPSQAGGIEKSLDAIARQPAGEIVFGVVAAGLIAFGILQIVTARYRVMRAS